MEKKWFVVHVLSGYEKEVKEKLLKRIKENNLEEYFGEILVPSEEIVEEGGEKGKVIFPGYILVQMVHIPADEREKDREKEALWSRLWKVVRRTPRVMGILGTRTEPTPLPEEEVLELKRKIETGELKPFIEYVPGDKIRVKEGPFANFNGEVEEVYPDKKRLRVLISIFGRSTPVELEFSQVEKV